MEITVPGSAPIVVSHEPSLYGDLKDVEDETLRKEFNRARRRLEDFARLQRGAVKTHQPPVAAG